jgi:protein SCO1/2
MASRTLIALVLALGTSTALAHPGDGQVAAPAPAPDDEIPPPPPTYQANGVTVEEHLGARVPLDALFRTVDGDEITLGDALGGSLPVILTFNYSDCPMLCSVQLNGLTASFAGTGEPGPSPDATKAADGKVAFRIGAQYRIVTIDLEPNESLEKLRAMRDRYVQRVPEAQRAGAARGWVFLAAAKPGDGAAIRRVADAVGFKYTYIKERAEWAHPAALIFLSSAGAVTRYVHGIQYEPAIMRESIYKAGLAESSTSAGFLSRCYHYDPDANSYAHAGVISLRLGAAAFVALLLGGFGLLRFLRRHRRWGVS